MSYVHVAYLEEKYVKISEKELFTRVSRPGASKNSLACVISALRVASLQYLASVIR